MVVNRALSLLLPHEEHQNPCLQVLVSEILSEMIFHNGICGKACESWLIWEGVTKVIYVVRPDLVPAPEQPDSPQVNRLEQFGLAAEDGDLPVQRSDQSRIDVLKQSFWTLVQSMWLAWLFLRSVMTALMHASSLPMRSTCPQSYKLGGATKMGLVDDSSDLDGDTAESHGSSPDSQKLPMLGMTIWPCLSTLARLQDRMPWLTGMMSLTQWLLLHGPGQVCRTDSRLDR